MAHAPGRQGGGEAGNVALFPCKMAEGVGFEPTERVTPATNGSTGHTHAFTNPGISDGSAVTAIPPYLAQPKIIKT
jgi:hypothetical protein